MSAFLLAVDAATLAALAALGVTLALTPRPRHDTFAHLARGFVGAMAAIAAFAVVAHALAESGLTTSAAPIASALEMLWAPMTLLVAYAMLARQQLESQTVAVRFFQRATELVGVVAAASPAGLLLLDPEGRITFANDAAMSLLELKEDPELGSVREPGWELHVAQDPAAGLAGLVTPAPLHDLPVVVEWPGNRRRRLCVNTLPMLRADGSISGVLAAFADSAPWLGTAKQGTA